MSHDRLLTLFADGERIINGKGALSQAMSSAGQEQV